MRFLTAEAKKNLPLCLLVSFFIICMIVQPQRYISSVLNGLTLFAGNVLPALFPFFFFTKLLSGLGFGEIVGNFTKKPITKLYNAPPISGYVLTMSLLSGYPVGARLLADLYEKNAITSNDVKKISTFTSTSGPLFVIGTIGTLMFGGAIYGYIMLVGHFASALVNGLIYRGRKTIIQPPSPTCSSNKSDLLSSSITNSLLSIMVVGSYIAIFGMIIDIFLDCKIIQVVSYPLSLLLELLNQPPEIAEGIVVSLVEITRGSQMLSKCGVDIKIILPWTAGLLSFGGVSIALQSLTFLGQCKVKMLYFFVTKLTQAILSFVFTYLLVLLIF